jgi:hypothetical protein
MHNMKLFTIILQTTGQGGWAQYQGFVMAFMITVLIIGIVHLNRRRQRRRRASEAKRIGADINNIKNRVERKYFYSDGVERKGPVTIEELKLIEGFSAGTLVCYEGSSDWVRADELSELSEVFGTATDAKPAKSNSESKKSMGRWALGLILVFAFIGAVGQASSIPKAFLWICLAIGIVIIRYVMSIVLNLLRRSDPAENLDPQLESIKRGVGCLTAVAVFPIVLGMIAAVLFLTFGLFGNLFRGIFGNY